MGQLERYPFSSSSPYLFLFPNLALSASFLSASVQVRATRAWLSKAVVVAAAAYFPLVSCTAHNNRVYNKVSWTWEKNPTDIKYRDA